MAAMSDAAMTPLTAINPADLPSLPLDERAALPGTPAIYFVLAGDTVLYIGQSVNMRQRWLAHHRFAQLDERGGCRIAWMEVSDTGLLDELERACIAHFSPLLNNAPLPRQTHGEEGEPGPEAEPMTWKAIVRLPESVGERVEQVARKWGVPPAVAARIVLMQHFGEGQDIDVMRPLEDPPKTPTREETPQG